MRISASTPGTVSATRDETARRAALAGAPALYRQFELANGTLGERARAQSHQLDRLVSPDGLDPAARRDVDHPAAVAAQDRGMTFGVDLDRDNGIRWHDEG